MKRLRIRIIIGILAAILVVGLIIYHIPQKRQSTMWVCSTSGEPAKFEMDLKYYRRLFRLPYVEGIVSLNGVEYQDQENRYSWNHINHNSQLEPSWGIAAGPDVVPQNMFFLLKNEIDHAKVIRNTIEFRGVSGKNSFEKIWIWYINETTENGIMYFGPAQTPEEAKQIAAYFGYITNYETHTQSYT